jgi:hypothetical protein
MGKDPKEIEKKSICKVKDMSKVGLAMAFPQRGTSKYTSLRSRNRFLPVDEFMLEIE